MIFMDDFAWTAPAGEGPAQRVALAYPPAGGPQIACPAGLATATYRPNGDHPSLFAMFAASPGTADGLLAFARDFGMLSARIGTEPVAEPLEDWMARHSWMQMMFSLLTMIQREQADALLAVAELDGQGAGVTLKWKGACVGTLPIPSWTKGETPAHVVFADAAARFIAAELDRRLWAHASLATRAGVKHWEEPDGLKLDACQVVQPRSLWGALLYQLYAALIDDRQHRQCGGCGDWFIIGAGAGRSHKTACSAGCRVRISRARGEEK